jgi:hypothetical protein
MFWSAFQMVSMGAMAALVLGALLGPLGYTMSTARSSAGGKARRADRSRR